MSVLDGKYQMDMTRDGFLGEGTSCLCARGRDTTTGELVAIKVYKSERSRHGDDGTTLTKFKRSIAVLKKLQDPFERPVDPELWSSQLELVKPAKLFVRLLDYSKDEHSEPGYDVKDGKLYLVTELAQQSLKQFVAKRREDRAPPSKETVKSVAKAILLVMAGLHAKGLVHMDVKPENLMVFDGCLKLIDVDGCVAIGTDITLTDSSISFSPIYCAPEWAKFLLGQKDSCLSASVYLDAWSVGCTICELITLDAVFRPTYLNFAAKSRRGGKANFMLWLKTLKEAPLPEKILSFDDELVELMSSCLLVCDKSQRKTCAEALNAPYFAVDALQRTKSSPIRAHSRLSNAEDE
jgi:serine/threonine protein kinase